MKTTAKKIARDENGNILILVLVLLVVGGLLLTPLLGLMSTGLVAGQVYEKKASELYAADAGVESAIWRIQSLQTNPLEWSGNRSQLAPLSVNDKAVDVDIYRTRVDGKTHCHIVYMYQIQSTAEGQTGSTTSVEAVLRSLDLDFSELTGAAIVSGRGATIQDQGAGGLCLVSGDIILDGPLDAGSFQHVNGNVTRETLIWPTQVELKGFYWADVKSSDDYYGDTEINAGGNHCPPGPVYINDEPIYCPEEPEPAGLGPLFIDGEVEILNKSNTEVALKLGGTLYITGDTEIGRKGQGGPPNLTLYLNGQTIFVESRSGVEDSGTAVWIDDWCEIKGPGAIVALGDIYVAPKGNVGDENNPVLIFSLEGKVHLQPSGNFHGSVVGYGGVYLAPKNKVIHPSSGLGKIKFPGMTEGKEVYTLLSWEIK